MKRRIWIPDFFTFARERNNSFATFCRGFPSNLRKRSSPFVMFRVHRIYPFGCSAPQLRHVRGLFRCLHLRFAGEVATRLFLRRVSPERFPAFDFVLHAIACSKKSFGTFEVLCHTSAMVLRVASTALWLFLGEGEIVTCKPHTVFSLCGNCNHSKRYFEVFA